MEVFSRIDALPTLSPEERQLLASVTKLSRGQIAAKATHYDEVGEFPWDNVKALAELGLNGIFLPQSIGGAGFSYAAYLACVKEISAACASTGIIWATNFHAIKPLLEFGTPEQQRRLLTPILAGGLAALVITEAGAGSDATGMTTTFTPEGDSIAVNGGKIFITNGDVADLYLVFGKWQPLGTGREAISALFIEKGAPGLVPGKPENKMGHRASNTTPLTFEGCRVPRANLLGQPGEGLRLLLASLNLSRPSIGAHALGIARAAFEDAVAYVNERRQGGKRIIEFQGVQFLLADLAAELAQCEAWLWHVARLVDSGVRDIGVEASMLKMRAADLAMRISTEAVQLHGGYGYIKEYRVERLMRDAKITQIWEGTSQMHRQVIGRSLVRK
ncbi:MAG TPA: acyl-CoA dehydrogenase family protein [bacterium]